MEIEIVDDDGCYSVAVKNGFSLNESTHGEVYDRLCAAFGRNGIEVENPLASSQYTDPVMYLGLRGNIPHNINRRNTVFNGVINELSTYNPR